MLGISLSDKPIPGAMDILPRPSRQAQPAGDNQRRAT